MNAKHTPGPWAIGLQVDNERAQIITADGEHLCYVEQYPVLPNARLVAAAPDLLAALEALEGYAADCAFDLGERPACLTVARAAILRAKGEA